MSNKYLLNTVLISVFFLHFTVYASGKITLDGVLIGSLEKAMNMAKKGSHIRIGAGIYKDGGVLKSDFVTIEGEDGVHLKGYSTQGKGTLVIKGNDTRIVNVECSEVVVPDGNGSCVRLEGKNIELKGVFFHDSQQGLLSGKNSGVIFIEGSRFENLGHLGQAHGIYVGSGELFINNSKFLSSRSEGHEIKSRAKKTIISNSTIASLDGTDSRLIDAPSGGVLEVTDCILQQGNSTSNWNLIGFGLEGIKHKNNTIKLQNNLFVLEREGGNLLLQTKGNVQGISATDNVIIGKPNDKWLDMSNEYFTTLKEANLSDFRNEL